MDPNPYCCKRMSQVFDKRNDRGLFVFEHAPGRPSTSTRPARPATFWLGFRSYRREDNIEISFDGDEDLVAPIWEYYDPIRFCPWCGIDIRQFYGDYPTRLHDPAFERGRLIY